MCLHWHLIYLLCESMRFHPLEIGKSYGKAVSADLPSIQGERGGLRGLRSEWRELLLRESSPTVVGA